MSEEIITTVDLYNYVHGIVSFNAIYLSIAIAIIIGSAIALYLFNVRPVEKELLKQEADLKLEREELAKIKSAIEDVEQDVLRITDDLQKDLSGLINVTETSLQELIKQNDEKVVESQSKLKSLEDKMEIKLSQIKERAELVELRSLLDGTYIWRVGKLKIPKNELRSLVTFLESSIEHNKFLLTKENIMERIDKILDEINEDDVEAGASGKNRDKRLYSDLEVVLGKLDFNSNYKNNTLTNARRILMPEEDEN